MVDLFFDAFTISGTVPARTDRHKLAGTVLVGGLPEERLVVVIDRVTFVILASTRSGPTGAWEITGIPEYPEGSLLVVAPGSDGENSYNALIFDYISQGPQV